jgi:hypothetical protein
MRLLLPPPEYDIPYSGRLTITRLASQDEVRAACPAAKWPANVALACNLRWGTTRCDVYIVADNVLNGYGIDYDSTLRHELAHCNGWPGDHPGARSVQLPQPLPQPRTLITPVPPLLRQEPVPLIFPK